MSEIEEVISKVAQDYFKIHTNPFDGNVILAKKEIEICMDRYAKLKIIEENKSFLKMAKLHMDSRAVMVISERIKQLEQDNG